MKPCALNHFDKQPMQEINAMRQRDRIETSTTAKPHIEAFRHPSKKEPAAQPHRIETPPVSSSSETKNYFSVNFCAFALFENLASCKLVPAVALLPPGTATASLLLAAERST